ncbi:MAG: DinB family protein [Vicinamibacterales bacterium]
MALTIAYDELLRYTNAERDKWRTWFGLHPQAMEAAVQPGGRFPTVGKLIDHIFLVERRHLQRITGDRLSQETGLSGSNASPLFDYGASVRRELEHLARTLTDEAAEELRAIDVRDRKWPMTTRKLLFHILLHEMRHWAQIALAVRLAGFDPPGDHDLFYSQALQ